MTEILIIAAAIIIGLMIVGLVLTRLYKRSTKETSFVRTGFGGQKVIMDGGALVLPVLHEVIPVNMNTSRLEVSRSKGEGLITKDRMRVDVTAEFYVRVKPDADSIAKAAQTLGRKTMSPDHLKELVFGKFVDSLRAVAAEMEMAQLHEKRVDFVQKVQQSVSEDLAKNGLELESVSLTGLDQTDSNFLNPNNAFDAEGLTRLTETIEDRKKKRNDIEQENRVAISKRDLEAELITLEVRRDTEYAQMEQEREISVRKAEQDAEIAKQQADRRREADQAQIEADRQVSLKRIQAEREIEQHEIDKRRSIEEAHITQKRAIELAEQDRQIAISQKSEEESDAKRKADEARISAVKAEESVITTRATEIAERNKAIEIIEAEKQAQRDAVSIRIQAEVEKEAASNRAEAKRLEAEGEKLAEIAKAEGREKYYEVESTGQRKINEAQNSLKQEQIEMAVRIKLLEQLPEIIAQSVKPMENIDSIKIVQMNGQSIGAGTGIVGNGQQGSSLSDQVVNSALAYRANAPLIDSLLKEVGIQGGDINGFTNSLAQSSQQPALEEIPPALVAETTAEGDLNVNSEAETSTATTE